MRKIRSLAGALMTISLSACAAPSEPQLYNISAALNNGNGVEVSTSGGGIIDFSAIVGAEDGYFSFSANMKSDGTALGHFRQRRVRNGLIVDFAGTVTCMSVDGPLGRARIGGVITQNNSTDPAFLTENHEVGDDVWFRVQDGGEGADAVDASTTYGFKPTLVNTSADYCALPFTGSTWNPASIFPLRSGNIQVRP